MNFLEKDLEDIIYENANTVEGRKLLEERGLEFSGHTYRQVSMGKYGIADLVNIHAYSDRIRKGHSAHYLDVNVIELKKDIINIDTLLQAVGYKKAVEEYFDNYCSKAWDVLDVKVTLIGKKIEIESNFVFLLDELDWLHAYTYSYSINGLHFEERYGWYKPNALDGNTVLKLQSPKIHEIADAFRQ